MRYRNKIYTGAQVSRNEILILGYYILKRAAILHVTLYNLFFEVERHTVSVSNRSRSWSSTFY